MNFLTLFCIFSTSTYARSADIKTAAYEAARNLFSRRGRSKFTSRHHHAAPIVTPVVEKPSVIGKVVELGTNVAMAVAAGGTLYQAVSDNVPHASQSEVSFYKINPFTKFKTSFKDCIFRIHRRKSP